MDIGDFYWSFLIGIVGLGYLMYGKKSSNIIAIISGITMMIYPYVVENIWISIFVGIGLIILPLIL